VPRPPPPPTPPPIATITASAGAAKQPPEESSSILCCCCGGGGHLNAPRSNSSPLLRWGRWVNRNWGRARTVQAGGADNDYRLDWDWTPDSGSPLAGLGIWDWGRTGGRNAALGRGRANQPQSHRLIQSPLLDFFGFFLARLSLRPYFLPLFPCGKDILPGLISCGSDC